MGMRGGGAVVSEPGGGRCNKRLSRSGELRADGLGKNDNGRYIPHPKIQLHFVSTRPVKRKGHPRSDHKLLNTHHE